jgi:hypothetical protein
MRSDEHNVSNGIVQARNIHKTTGHLQKSDAMLEDNYASEQDGCDVDCSMIDVHVVMCGCDCSCGLLGSPIRYFVKGGRPRLAGGKSMNEKIS